MVKGLANPQRKKKRRLTGVCARNRVEPVQHETSRSIGSFPSSSEEGTSSSTAPSSASKTKISGNLESFCTDSHLNSHGFALVDTSILCEFLDKATYCEKCFHPTRTYVDWDNAQGFAVSFRAKCLSCHFDTNMFSSSKRCEKTDIIASAYRPFEVNARMVTYVREIGKGHSALEKFGTIMNTTAMDSHSYNGLFDKLHQACEEQANDSMVAASSELKSELGQDVMVSIDGSWQRRGHSSRNGVITVIGAANGKVLDTEVLYEVRYVLRQQLTVNMTAN